MWNGRSINPRYRSLADIHDAVKALCHEGAWEGAWELAWVLKAGEGGTYQSTWDTHALAIDGPAKLATMVDAGRALDPPLAVIPYIVVRGRDEWNEAEWQQIADCARVAGHVILNLEPGTDYWNGPTDPCSIWSHYLDPLLDRLNDVPQDAIVQLAAIPSEDVSTALWATLREWLTLCDRSSWECYGLAAPVLAVDVAIPRVEAAIRGWGVNGTCGPTPDQLVPIVQRGEIARWAGTSYAAHGLEVWHLDGDL